VPEFARQRGLACGVVIGGGAAGVELALAMRHRLGSAGHVCLVAGEGPLLPGHGWAVRRLAERALDRHGVMCLHERCVGVDDRSVRLASGLRLACDVPIIATGGRPAAWLAASGLAVDEQGAVRTGATLQSISHPEVFAAGDNATRDDAPRPKSGVFAVRAGPPLALNLRRHLAHGALKHYRPQRLSLNLLACGERRAIASWGAWAVEGAWVWRWKDRIDRRWVDGIGRAATAGATASA
jgi:NADH dehydrogenase FAD-containing subunit